MAIPFQRSIERGGPPKRFFADELHTLAWPSFLARPKLRRRLLVSVALVTMIVDYLTGPTIRFPAFYGVPVLLAAWYEGFGAGLLAGVAVVGARLVMEAYLFPVTPWPLSDSLLNAATNVSMIAVVCWFAGLAGRLSREVRLLWGLVPICMYCHRIRDEKNTWWKLELYLEDRSQAAFSHGVCPACMKTHTPTTN